MKKKTEMIKKAAFAVLVIVVFMTVLASAAAEEYSTENDPLVSLSYINGVLVPGFEHYVDEKVQSVSAEEIVSELMSNEEFRQYVSSVIASMSHDSSGTASSSEFITLRLSAGKRLTAGSKCEIIVRSGQAAAVCPSEGAVKDLSADRTLKNGDTVITGNFIEISYADGSGIVALQTTTEILVRGEFTVGE